MRGLIAVMIVWLPACLHAEYRVALLIGEDESAGALEALGFRCEKSPLLGEKELKRKIEGWTSTTPTNSTAVICYGGDVREEKSVLSLMSDTKRVVSVPTVFEMMRQRGGSRTNVLLVKDAPSTEAALPDDCVLSSLGVAAFAEKYGISGRGSIAVSPPDKFVPGRQAGDEWVNARGMVFCWCPPGTYTAGSPVNTPGRYADEEERKVVIGHGFWIAKYEHTLGQKIKSRGSMELGDDKNDPVVKLHWDDGSRMVQKTLTGEEQKAGRLPAEWEYSLPTADQWEYAARAGTTGRFYFGDDVRELPGYANFADKSYYDSGDIFSNASHRELDDGFVRLAPVGSFKPNPWGLHDVYGNVTEWCIDKAALGGSWVSVAENCRSAYRDYHSSRDDQIYLGYRFIIQPRPK